MGKGITYAAGIAMVVGVLSGCARQSNGLWEGGDGGSVKVSRGESFEVVVDTKGVDSDALSRDKIECRQYANSVNTGGNVASGAVAGGLFGAAVGALVGDSDFAAELAGVGALSGGAAAYGGSQMSRGQIVKNCMRGRGYRVLN